MAVTSEDTNFQQLVLERLDQINDHLDQLERDQRETNLRLELFQRDSEGVVGMAKTIMITAGVAVIFAPLVTELAPTIAAFLHNRA